MCEHLESCETVIYCLSSTIFNFYHDCSKNEIIRFDLSRLLLRPHHPQICRGCLGISISEYCIEQSINYECIIAILEGSACQVCWMICGVCVCPAASASPPLYVYALSLLLAFSTLLFELQLCCGGSIVSNIPRVQCDSKCTRHASLQI